MLDEIDLVIKYNRKAKHSEGTCRKKHFVFARPLMTFRGMIMYY